MGIQNIAYFRTGEADTSTPIVIVHTFENEGEALHRELIKTGCGSCCIAAVTVDKWEEDLSPWPAKRVFKGESDFGSGADAHIADLTRTALPEIREKTGSEGPCYIAGYSFAGLFALYSLYRTDIFAGAASVSGSLWFPGFSEFAMSHDLQREPDFLYFSLGDKESLTRNELMKTVAEKTGLFYTHYRDLGINCTFEMNPGNHFTEPERRLAKGICRLLTECGR